MKSFMEHMEAECLDEEQLELTEEQLEELVEGRVGIVAKSAIAVLRAKQQAYRNRVLAEKNIDKKMDILSEQIASSSSAFIVLLAVMNKDTKGMRRVR